MYWERSADLRARAAGRRLWTAGRVLELERTDAGLVRALVLDDRRCYVELDPERFGLKPRTGVPAGPPPDPEPPARPGSEPARRNPVPSYLHSTLSRSVFAPAAESPSPPPSSREEDGEVWYAPDRSFRPDGIPDPDQAPEGVFCSCRNGEPSSPEAAGLCPHAVALLCALEAGLRIPEHHVIPFGAPDPDWRGTIASLPPADLQALLTRLCEQHPLLREAVLLYSRPDLPAPQLERWRLRLRQMVLAVCGNRRAISREAAARLSDALQVFLADTLSPLLEQGRIPEAFELLCVVHLETRTLVEPPAPEETPDGAPSLQSGIRALFRSLITRATPRQRQELMYGWFLESHRSMHDDPVTFPLLFSPIWEPEELEHSLDLLRQELDDTERDSAAWIPLAEHGLLLLHALGRTPEEAASLLGSSPLPDQGRRSIAAFLAAGPDPDAELLFLQACRLLDPSSPGPARELADLCQRRGELELCRKERWNLLLLSPQATEEDYEALRAVLPEEEWPALQETILRRTDPGLQGLRVHILVDSHLYRRLADELRRTRDLKTLLAVEEPLRRWDETTTRNLLAELIPQRIESASSRADYDQCVRLLRRLAAYPGGLPLARHIADLWRLQYPRRRSMQDALFRAGF